MLPISNHPSLQLPSYWAFLFSFTSPVVSPRQTAVHSVILVGGEEPEQLHADFRGAR